MPVACFLNEDIKKIVVEIEDRHHYLALTECDDLIARLEGAVVANEPTCSLPLHDRVYTLKREPLKVLLAQTKTAATALEALVGRPKPPVTVQAQLDKLAEEKSALQKELDALKAKFEAKVENKAMESKGPHGAKS